jgi:Holliday junction resolvase RusA-like endonuclease
VAENLSLTLDDLPPSANSIWRAHNGRVLKSREYRAWLDATALQFRAQAKGRMVDGWYKLTVEFGRPNRVRRDIDNLMKPLCDAIAAAGCIEGDWLCAGLAAEWNSRPGVRAWIVSTTEPGVCK